jgi:ABC-type sugar transport system substrate-binding protein
MQRFSSSRWRRGLAAAVVLAAVTLALAAAAQSTVSSDASPSAKRADITLALVLNDLTNPVSLPLRKGAEDASKKYGFTL